MLAAPSVEPYAAPTSSTANVCPVIGTGVKPSRTEICAISPTNPAPPRTSSASVSSPERGNTASLRVMVWSGIEALDQRWRNSVATNPFEVVRPNYGDAREDGTVGSERYSLVAAIKNISDAGHHRDPGTLDGRRRLRCAWLRRGADRLGTARSGSRSGGLVE